ncbi:alpha/beta fold hydrolase [Cryptosporangium sp. NPDC051539]|uniref:alpha/beta fold hydrolase n=1 Tax=Cryptosporangium sp. NPDC051539 TaxID=3363962 RepID=UPI0037B5A2D8
MADVTAHHGIFKDTKLHVDDYGGPGRPVVLLHGWPLSGEAFAGNVPAVTAAGYRAVTYDRRGFGRSDKTLTGYGYDTLTEDLHTVLEALDLRDVTLVGFSMGGGEVARYFTKYGSERVHSVVFASAVPPYLAKTSDNPDGPLPRSEALKLSSGLAANQDKFYDRFITDFFSANGVLAVTEAQRQEALALTAQASKTAALESMTSWGNTDFREDLPKVSVPALVLHGDADATVPYEGSGQRTLQAVPQGSVHLIAGGPHGVNVSHADEWNQALVRFLAK